MKIQKQLTLCGINPKATAEHLGGTRVRFTSPCGYRYTQDFSKGPVSKRLPVSAVRMFSKYWKSTGVISECPRCRRAASQKEHR